MRVWKHPEIIKYPDSTAHRAGGHRAALEAEIADYDEEIATQAGLVEQNVDVVCLANRCRHAVLAQAAFQHAEFGAVRDGYRSARHLRRDCR